MDPAKISFDIKGMTYGLAYGLSAFGLSQQIGIPPDDQGRGRVHGREHEARQADHGRALRVGPGAEQAVGREPGPVHARVAVGGDLAGAGPRLGAPGQP